MWEMIDGLSSLIGIVGAGCYLYRKFKKLNNDYSEIRKKLERLDEVVTRDELNPEVTIDCIDSANKRLIALESEFEEVNKKLVIVDKRINICSEVNNFTDQIRWINNDIKKLSDELESFKKKQIKL